MISLIGVAPDANSSHMFGAAEGPAAIRAASHSGSSNESTESSVVVVPMLDDIGDVAISNERCSAGDAEAITAAVAAQLAAGRRVITIGGDHSITDLNPRRSKRPNWTRASDTRTPRRADQGHPSTRSHRQIDPRAIDTFRPPIGNGTER
jgi:Arginase family